MSLYFVSRGKRFKSLGDSLYVFLKKQELIDDFYCLEELEKTDNLKRDDLVYSNYFIDPLKTSATIISPNYVVAKYWDNKINQYNDLSDVVLVPYYRIYQNVFELSKDLKNIKTKCFITGEYGEGGDFSIILDKSKPFSLSKFMKNKKQRIRVSEFLEIAKEISVHVVIFEKDIVIGPILRQRNEDDVCFKSVEYPTCFDLFVLERIKDVSNRLRSSGYLGVVGIDLIIDVYNNVYLLEINPRKMGSSIIDSLMFEMHYGYSLSVLEYLSVTRKRPNLKKVPVNIKWKLEMSKDLSPCNFVPGDEVNIIRSQKSFSVEYIDYYKPNDMRRFIIKGMKW